MVGMKVNLLSATRRAMAHHPIAAFLIIGNAVFVAASLIPPFVNAKVLPFDLPLWGSLSSILGVGLAAFLVTAATAGRAGVDDLVRRTLHWRVPRRWYLIALLTVPVAATLFAIAMYGMGALESPSGGWARALGVVLAVFVLQLVLFQLGEEIGWTGFLQHRLQDRYRPLKLSAMVALPWAVWHLPDFFAYEGWMIAQLVPALVYLLFEIVVLFFARVLIVWLYNSTGQSILLVAVFHASFDATVSKLSLHIIPESNTVRVIVLSGIVVLWALGVVIATRGQLGRSPRLTRNDPGAVSQ
jgi:membrane protease YdiL (CAAX protease family)